MPDIPKHIMTSPTQLENTKGLLIIIDLCFLRETWDTGTNEQPKLEYH